MSPLRLDDIQVAAADYGLVARGGFAIRPEDDVPGYGCGSLVLFGNAGSAMWQPFSQSPEYADGQPEPLNRWSERVGGALAQQWGGAVFFPFGGPPYRPFLRWAGRAEGVRRSRLGMFIHPRYGLWHAYRFAIAVAAQIALPTPTTDTDICAQCVSQPCLSACPVAAFDGTHYAVEECCHYLRQHAESACMTDTCAARAACPEGAAYRYQRAHGRFHMQAFVSQMTDDR